MFAYASDGKPKYPERQAMQSAITHLFAPLSRQPIRMET
jgi:hypothetical protein